MFVGELEYGDHPFHEGFAFNYVVFAMFVFFIVIVMMNLLTTVAILGNLHLLLGVSWLVEN